MEIPAREFLRPPLRSIEGIPCFTEVDAYVRNYERIANDHLAAITPDSQNPWMPDDLYNALRDSTVALVRKYARAGDRILDVGVSTGRLLDGLGDLDRYGIDISVEYLQIARSKGIKVALAKAEDLPFVDNLFRIVTLTDVVEHFADLTGATRRIAASVRPGGYIIVRTPYRENLAPYLNPDLRYDFIHLRNFDENSLRLHFDKIGGCDYVEEAGVAPHYTGPSRFRRQLFRRSDDKVAKLLQDLDSGAIGVAGPVRAMLKALISVREEDLAEWMYSISVNKDPVFDLVKDALLEPLEFNMVFKKR